MSVRSLLKLNKSNKIHLGSLKAIFVKVSQNFIKSHLKFCLISQISAHSLWHVHVCDAYSKAEEMIRLSRSPENVGCKNTLGHYTVLQIRRGNRDNLGMIFFVFP